MEQLRNMFSLPMREQHQDPETAPFANDLRGVHPDHNMLPPSLQGSSGPHSMYKGPHTNNTHQEVPQGSNGLNNTTDITMESDMNSRIQGGAANASVLPQTRTLYTSGASELSPSSAHGNTPSRHGLRLNTGNSPGAVTSAVNVFAQGAPQGAASPPFSSSSNQHKHGIAAGLGGSISPGLGITIPNHSGSFSPSGAQPGLLKGLGFVSGISAAAAGAGYGNDPTNTNNTQSHQGARSSFNDFRSGTTIQQDEDDDNYNTGPPQFSRSPSRSPYLSAHSRPLTPHSEAHSPSAYPPPSPYPSPGPSPLALSPGGGGLSPGPPSPGPEGSGAEGDDFSPTQSRGRLRGRPRGSPKSPQQPGSAGPWSSGPIQQTQFMQDSSAGDAMVSHRSTVGGRHSRSRGKSVGEAFTPSGSRGGSPYPHHGQVESRGLGRKISASAVVRGPSQQHNFTTATSQHSHGIPPLEIHNSSIPSSRDPSVAPYDPSTYMQPYPHSYPQQQQQFHTPHSDQYLNPPMSPHSPHIGANVPVVGSPTGVFHSPHSLSPHSLSPHSVPPPTPSPEMVGPNVAGAYAGSTHSSPGLGLEQMGGMVGTGDLQFMMDPGQIGMQVGNMGSPDQGTQYAQATYANDGLLTGMTNEFGMTQTSGSSGFPGSAAVDSAWQTEQLPTSNMGLDTWPHDQNALLSQLTEARVQEVYGNGNWPSGGNGPYSLNPANSVQANAGELSELAALRDDPTSVFWDTTPRQLPNPDPSNGVGALGVVDTSQWSRNMDAGQHASMETQTFQQPVYQQPPIYHQQLPETLPYTHQLLDPSTVPPSPAKGVLLPWDGQPTSQLPPGGMLGWQGQMQAPNGIPESMQQILQLQDSSPHPNLNIDALAVPPRRMPTRRRSKSDSDSHGQYRAPQQPPPGQGYYSGQVYNSPRKHSNTLAPSHNMDFSAKREDEIFQADGPGLKLRKTLPAARGHRQTISAVPSLRFEDWSDRTQVHHHHPPLMMSQSYQGPSAVSHGAAPLHDNYGVPQPGPSTYTMSGHQNNPQPPPFTHTTTYPPPNPIPNLPRAGGANLGRSNSNSKQKQQGQRNEIDEGKLAGAFMPGSFRVDPVLRYLLDIIRTYAFYLEDRHEPLLGTPEAEQIFAQVRARYPHDVRFASRNDPRFVSQAIDKEAETQSIFMTMTENNRCLICGQQKDRTGRALGHVRSDIGHRPYHCTCEKCSQSANPRRFFSDNLLDDHLKGQQVKQECVYCHSLFRRGGMKRHIASKHPEHVQGTQGTQENQDDDYPEDEDPPLGGY